MSVMVHSGGGSGDSDLLEGGDGVWPPASPFPLPFTTGFGLRHPRFPCRLQRGLASGIPVARLRGLLKADLLCWRTTFFLCPCSPYANRFATVRPGTKKDDARWASSGLLLSGKRDSNPRPSAWEADALPTELFPQMVLQI